MEMVGRTSVFIKLLFAWCGYEIARMILLHDLKGALQLDHGKDMFMPVSACTSYDFNALTPVVWKLCH
jgi:hypothetical protein